MHDLIGDLYHLADCLFCVPYTTPTLRHYFWNGKVLTSACSTSSSLWAAIIKKSGALIREFTVIVTAMGGRVTKEKTCPGMCRPPTPNPNPTSIFRGPVNDEDYEYRYTLLLVGCDFTGQTSFIWGFVGGKFPEHFDSIGVTNRIIDLDGSRIKVEMWDIPGFKRNWTNSVVKFFCRARFAHGMIIVYDATREETFEHVPHVLEEVKQYGNPETTIMLVGIKCDLTKEKVVDYRTAKDFADKRGIMLMEVSAKDGTNVELAFVTLVAKIRQADF